MIESVTGTTRSPLEINMNEMVCFIDWVYLFSLNISIVFILHLPNLNATCYLIYKAIISWMVIGKQQEDTLVMP